MRHICFYINFSRAFQSVIFSSVALVTKTLFHKKIKYFKVIVSKMRVLVQKKNPAFLGFQLLHSDRFLQPLCSINQQEEPQMRMINFQMENKDYFLNLD